MKNPKVLIVCEESGTVTEEFRKLNIRAFSCDILPTSGGHPEWHIQKDVLSVIGDNWDCMIAFPPCTYLSNVGNRWFNVDVYEEKAIERHRLRIEAFEFFYKLWTASIKHICIENPVGYVNKYIKKTQLIHPYYFGDSEMKKTCLWLKNLPPLQYSLETNLFEKKTAADKPQPYWRHPEHAKKAGQAVYFTERHGYTNPKDRAKIRSKTFPGIGKAMAAQWGKFLLEIEENV